MYAGTLTKVNLGHVPEIAERACGNFEDVFLIAGFVIYFFVMIPNRKEPTYVF